MSIKIVVNRDTWARGRKQEPGQCCMWHQVYLNFCGPDWFDAPNYCPPMGFEVQLAQVEEVRRLLHRAHDRVMDDAISKIFHINDDPTTSDGYKEEQIVWYFKAAGIEVVFQ